ncbi:MAG TPA: hypothetical protein VH743_09330 [Beijerinckiaceae bacterium]|jgi:hypothetical protein
MVPYSFSHSGATYDLLFTRSDGRWFAALWRVGDKHARLLPSLQDEFGGRFSDNAIRSGFITLAEWLITSGRWAAREREQECQEFASLAS